MNRAALIDRDGTIIVDKNYIRDPDQVELLPHAVEGLKILTRLKLPLILCSNQSGVARGYFTEAELQKVQDHMVTLLKAHGVSLAATYYCVHHAEGSVPEFSIDCDCRKPKPGLLVRAMREQNLDPGASFMIGDSLRDTQAGRAAGVRTVLVMTGHARMSGIDTTGEADYVASDLLAAAKWIENQITGRTAP